MVPPPRAVTQARRQTPNQSILRRPAARAAVIASTVMAMKKITSSISEILTSKPGCCTHVIARDYRLQPEHVMRHPKSVKALEELGRVRLSKNFFLRDFLYSEIAVIRGFANIPDNPDLAIAAGKVLCEPLLEPLQALFGKISIRSTYCASEANHCCNINKLNCGLNETNFGGHI